MSNGRPSAKILLTTQEGRFTIDILEATGSYVVLYKGQPFSLRKTIINNYIDAPKYLRTYYPTPSHAWNLADKLNARYDTTEFTVQEIHTGRILPRPTPE